MLELRCLGTLDLRGPAGTVDCVLAQPKRAALLVCLAVARPRGFQRRDTLLTLFWPESDAFAARHALNQAIYQLRQVLGDDVVVSRGKEEVGLAPGTVHCDVAAFEDAIQREDWSEALDHYRGGFLQGFHISEAAGFERWLDGERERLRELAAKAAWGLAHERIGAGLLVEAERSAQRALRLAPTDETPVRAFIEALADAGERAAALSFYEKFAAVLAEELEVEPAPETVAAVAGIRQATEAVEPAPALVQPPVVRRDAEIPTEGAGPARARRPAPLVAAVVVVVVAAAAWSLYGARGDDPDPTLAALADRPSVAVLPLTVLSDREEDVFLATGLHDAILSQLSRITGLRVVSRTTVERYATEGLTMPEIGRDLGVMAVTEGTLQRNGDRLRVSVQLIDAATDSHLWSQQYEQFLEDAFAVQSDIALNIAGSLVENLPEEQRSRLESPPTWDPVAYDLYLRGVEQVWHHQPRGADYLAAELLLEEALRRDSAFALAHAALANAYSRTWRSWERDPAGRDPLPGLSRGFDRRKAARSHAERALALDADLPQGHTALGVVLENEQDYWGALAQYEVAEQLGPGDADVVRLLAYMYRDVGRPDDAMAAFRRTVALDGPYAYKDGVLGPTIFMDARQYGEAIAAANRAIELDPMRQAAHLWRSQAFAFGYGVLDSLWARAERFDTEVFVYWQGAAYAGRWDELAALPLPPLDGGAPFLWRFWRALAHRKLGDETAAHACFDTLYAEAEPFFEDTIWFRARDARYVASLALAGLGRGDEVQEHVDWLWHHFEERVYGLGDCYFSCIVPQWIAEIHAFAGQVDEALAAMQVADTVPANGWLTPHVLRLWPQYDPIRGDPRFQAYLTDFERRFEAEQREIGDWPPPG